MTFKWRNKNQNSTPVNLGTDIGISHTGSTAETTLGTLVIPAGKLSVGDVLDFAALFEIDDGAGGNSAGDMTARVKLDGVNLVSIGTIAGGLEVGKMGVVKSATVISASGAGYFAPAKMIAGFYNDFTVDITADITITYTVILSNAADTAYLGSYSILLAKA